MQLRLHRFPLTAALTVMLGVAVFAGQKAGKSPNPPASPQAKTPQPATHFTQGTISSIKANQLVIAKSVRGKAEQMTFVLTSETQRTGTLVAGTRVSVQYRESNNQNIAAAVRELPADEAAKSGKTAVKPKTKS